MIYGGIRIHCLAWAICEGPISLVEQAAEKAFAHLFSPERSCPQKWNGPYRRRRRSRAKNPPNPCQLPGGGRTPSALWRRRLSPPDAILSRRRHRSGQKLFALARSMADQPGPAVYTEPGLIWPGRRTFRFSRSRKLTARGATVALLCSRSRPPGALGEAWSAGQVPGGNLK